MAGGRNTRAYDVRLGSLGLVIAGGRSGREGKPINPAWSVDWETPELEGDPGLSEVPNRQETWHFGGGFGRSYVPGCYSYAENMDGSQPGCIIMGPLVTRKTFGGSASCSDFFEVDGKLYALSGRYCKRIDPSDDTVKTPDSGADGIDFGASVTASKAKEYQGNIYVGFTSDTPIQQFTGSAWSNDDPTPGGSDTATRAKFFAKDYVEEAGWRLWMVYGTASMVGASGSPLDNANLGTVYTIGDTGQAATGVVGTDGGIWIAKKDGLYLHDGTDRSHNVLESMGRIISVDNGRELMADGSVLYVPHVAGLLEYNRLSGGIRSVQPFAYTGNISGIVGTPTAQTKLGPWHYVAIYDGTNAWILKGRYPMEGEGIPQGWVGPMIWHPIVKIATCRIDCMWLSGLTTPARLWFGYTSSTTYDVGYIRVSKTGNSLAESSMTYAASGSVYFSPQTFGVAGTNKELIGFDIENEGFDATTYAALFVSRDGGSYTQWGSSATTAGRTRLTLPSGTWSGYNLRWRLDLTNASSSATPKITAVVGRASLRPTWKKRITMQILASDDMTLRDGSKLAAHKQTAASLLTTLEGYADDAPMTLQDWWTGSLRETTVLVGRPREQMIEQRGNDPASYGCELVCREV